MHEPQGSSFVRRLERSEVEAEVVDPGGLAAAVLASDIVLVEALAASTTEMMATPGSRAAASVAYCSEVPVWAVLGRGRCLPTPAFDGMVQRVGEVHQPWYADAEVVPFALASFIAGERGVASVHEVVLAPECPLAHELLATRRA